MHTTQIIETQSRVLQVSQVLPSTVDESNGLGAIRVDWASCGRGFPLRTLSSRGYARFGQAITWWSNKVGAIFLGATLIATAIATAACGPAAGVHAGTTRTIQTFADLSGAFVPQIMLSPVVSTVPELQEVSTPYGPGFAFVSQDSDVAVWNAKLKAVLANVQNVVTIGQAQEWSWNMMLPPPTRPTSGLLFQWHTDQSSGHHLTVEPDGNFHIFRQSAPGLVYDIEQGPAVPWGQWVPVEFDIKWSNGDDGYLKVTIGGVQYMNYSGQTVFDAGTPYLQFGWYGYQGNGTNQVEFGPITVTDV